MKTTKELLDEAAENGRNTPLHELVNGIPEEDMILGQAREDHLLLIGTMTDRARRFDGFAIEARSIAYDIGRALEKPIPEAHKILADIPDRIAALGRKIEASK